MEHLEVHPIDVEVVTTGNEPWSFWPTCGAMWQLRWVPFKFWSGIMEGKIGFEWNATMCGSLKWFTGWEILRSGVLFLFFQLKSCWTFTVMELRPSELPKLNLFGVAEWWCSLWTKSSTAMEVVWMWALLGPSNSRWIFKDATYATVILLVFVGCSEKWNTCPSSFTAPWTIIPTTFTDLLYLDCRENPWKSSF